MRTELSLQGQTWIMDDGQQVDTREIFARLLAEKMGNTRQLINTRVRAKESNEARPVESLFRLIGHYGVLGTLGEGAFGQVYLGFDARKRSDGKTGRLVAIKMPNDSLINRYADQQVNLEADTLGMDTSNATERRRWARMSIGQLFAKEATLTARLAMCPHVVKVLDQDVMAPFLVLEFCNGGALSNRLREPYEIKHVLNWGEQIATALDAAHSLQPDYLVHRDLKPDNILFMGDILKITDFGTSKLVEATESLRSLQGGYTPVYGAPEAFDGKAYPASDVWSLGVMLYEMLSGAPPFRGDSILKLITSITGKEPRPIMDVSKLTAPPALHSLIMDCLKKEPEDRPTARQCIQRLQEMSRSSPDLYLEVSTEKSQEALQSGSAMKIEEEAFRHAKTMVSEEDAEDEDDESSESAAEEAAVSSAPGPAQTSNAGLWGASALVLVAAVVLAVVLSMKGSSSLELSAPAQGSILSDRELLVKGQASPGATLRWGSRQTSANDKGQFEFRAKLKAGAQKIVVEELGGDGVVATIERDIVLDYDKPVLQILSDRATVTQSQTLLIKGQAKDDSSAVTVKVNGSVAQLDSEGIFQVDLPLKEGKNDIVIEAADQADHSIDPIRWTCLRDSRGTVISFIQLKDGDWVPSELTVKGRVQGKSALTQLTVNGQSVPVRQSQFQATLTVQSDPFVVECIAKDEAGHTSKKTARLRWDVTPPQFAIKGEKAGALRLAPGDSLEGTVIEKNLKALTVNGEAVTVKAGGQFQIAAKAGTKLLLKATDQAGQSVTKELWIAEELKTEDLKVAQTLLSNAGQWRSASVEKQDEVLKIVSLSLGQEYQQLESQSFGEGSMKTRLGRYLHKKSGVVLHLIPGGSFEMGQQDGRSDERPVHTVTISKPFLIAAMELGQGEWDKVGGEDQRSFKGADLPIESVTWTAAKAWLAKAGGQLRLPSEAEWEYACRAGSTGPYFWGSSFDKSYVWGQMNAQRKSAARSLHKGKSNGFGLIDMLGNLYEWVEDDWFESYNGSPTDGSARVVKGSRKKVIRGGYWGSREKDLRCAERSGAGTSLPTSRIGLRPARSLNLQ